MAIAPLAGQVATVGADAGSELLRVMLSALGAHVTGGDRPDVRLNGSTVPLCRRTVEQEWSAAGLGQGWLVPVGNPAGLARACALAVALLSANSGKSVRVGGPQLLGERARILGLPVASRRSAGGSARLIEAADGWFALSLPTPADIELVPALVEKDLRDEPWTTIRRWASRRSRAEIEARTTLLGLAVGTLSRPADVAAPFEVRPIGTETAVARRGVRRSRLVVNLGSLWASPLCAQLLRRAGHRVVDIESPQRPDGSGVGAATFYARLHHGHERQVLDLRRTAGCRALSRLIDSADVIITGSRYSALRRIGALPPPEPRRDQVWVAISAHGMRSNRIGFGDDAAVAGGLVAWTPERTPVFAGDAIADPLTGLAAATATFACLGAGGSWQVKLALRDVAAFAAQSS